MNTGEWAFEEEHEFLEKLEGLVGEGVARERIEVVTPVPVHRTESILGLKRSPLRFFTLAGGLTGLAAGFAITISTVKAWPLMTGGKPLISIPPFIIIAFTLTILLSAIFTFVGFLILSKLPSAKGITEPHEHENRFIIKVT